MRFSERLKIANYRVFSGKIGRFFSETDFCEENMGHLRDFVRYFPNSFPRNLFFFPRDFENVRQNCTNKP